MQRDGYCANFVFLLVLSFFALFASSTAVRVGGCGRTLVRRALCLVSRVVWCSGSRCLCPFRCARVSYPRLIFVCLSWVESRVLTYITLVHAHVTIEEKVVVVVAVETLY